MEMYNGHQYAAVRLPDDRVCAFGNEFLLQYLSDYADCIVSPGLESLDSLKPIPPLPIRLDAGEWQSILSTLDASTQEAGNP